MIKKRIVIVEDDLIIQELHRHYVQNIGHEVVATFTNGKEVIDFFTNNTADLILMDIRLEDSIDGIETMKQIQLISNVPVVYISGNTEDSNLKRAIDTNMKGFLNKPIAQGDLEKAIDSLNELTDSILYADRIQKAIFPQRRELNKIFGDYVYINRPRNIISGDFSFVHVSRKKKLLMGGIGDCTGHGIPAALLSVLSHEIITSLCKKNTDLGKILFLLNKKMNRNLNRIANENQVADGLDLILYKVIHENKVIEIAGLKRPFIHYIADKSHFEYVPFRGLGIGQEIKSPQDVPIISLPYDPNDCFYFFSDGITDQFGGMFSKKLTKRGLINFLKAAHEKEIEKEININLAIRKWQGSVEQTDDMILFGFCPSKISTEIFKTRTK